MHAPGLVTSQYCVLYNKNAIIMWCLIRSFLVSLAQFLPLPSFGCFSNSFGSFLQCNILATNDVYCFHRMSYVVVVCSAIWLDYKISAVSTKCNVGLRPDHCVMRGSFPDDLYSWLSLTLTFSMFCSHSVTRTNESCLVMSYTRIIPYHVCIHMAL